MTKEDDDSPGTTDAATTSGTAVEVASKPPIVGADVAAGAAEGAAEAGGVGSEATTVGAAAATSGAAVEAAFLGCFHFQNR